MAVRGPYQGADAYTMESHTSKLVRFDGGLDLKTDAFAFTPPLTTTANNVWYITPGQVRSLPPLSQGSYSNFPYINTYSVFARDSQEPFKQGVACAWAEVADTNIQGTLSLSSPVIINPPDGLPEISQNPVYPHTFRQRPFNTSLGIDSGFTLNAGSFSPVYVINSVLNMACSAVIVNTTGNTFVIEICPASVNGTVYNQYASTVTFTNTTAGQSPQFDIFPTTTGFILGATVNTGSVTQLQLWNVVANSLAATNPFTITGFSGTPLQLFSSSVVVGTTQWQFVTYTAAATLGVGIYANIGGSLNFYGVNSATYPTSLVTIATAQQTQAITTWQTASTLFFGYGTANGTYVIKQYPNSSSPTTAKSTTTLTISAATGPILTATGGSVDNTSGVGNGALFLSYSYLWSAVGPFAAWGSVSQTSVVFTYNATSLTEQGEYYWNTWTGSQMVCRAFNLSGTNQCVLFRTASSDPNTTVSKQYAQPTYFLLDHQLRCIGRFDEATAPLDTSLNNTSAVTSPSQTFLPSVQYYAAPNSATMYEYVLPIWRNVVEGFGPGIWTSSTAPQITSANAFVLGNIGLPNVIQSQPVLASFAMPANLGIAPVLTAGRSQVVPGLVTSMYDGRVTHEAGWHNSPHVIATGATGSGGSTTDYPIGTYLYRAIYRWSDSNGQVHRSSPSPVFSKTQSTAGWASQTVYIPAPVHTARGDKGNAYAGGGIFVELYRTDPAGTTFYLVGSAFTNLQNLSLPNPGTTQLNGAIITDTQPVLASSNFGVAYPAYWQNTYESSPPPSFIWQCSSQGRTFGVACVDGAYRLYFTNVWVPGISVEWNVYGYVPIPAELGDIRSCASLDANVFVFGTRGVGVMTGTGPSSAVGSNGIDLDVQTGSGGFSLISPIRTSGGVFGSGCPVTCPAGVIYQAADGFSLINASLTISLIGAQVDPLTGYTGITGINYGTGQLINQLQGIVFTNPGGDSLFFDYENSAWSIWQASVVGPIAAMTQRQDGSVYFAQQTVSGATLPTNYTTNNATVANGISIAFEPSAPALYAQSAYTIPQYQIETPWIQVGDVMMGDGNVWEALVLGYYENPHILQVEVAVNGEAYGTLSNYLTQVAWPNSTYPNQAYQYRVTTPTSTRCWAIRYRITVLPPTSTTQVFDYARITGLMLYSGSIANNWRTAAGVSR